jgi:hypothetical protein
MYFDVQLVICSLMFFSFYITHFLVLLWPADGPSCGRNWSPFNKHFVKSALVVMGEFLGALIYESRTQPLYCDRQYD